MCKRGSKGVLLLGRRGQLRLGQVEWSLGNLSGQPVGSLSFALQDRGGEPHYISLHVGPLSPSPQRLFCLFREPKPFKATFGLMSPLSANDPQRGPPLTCSPLLLSPYFSATYPHYHLSYIFSSSAQLAVFLILPCLAHFLLPAGSLFSQTCHPLSSFHFLRTAEEPPSFQKHPPPPPLRLHALCCYWKCFGLVLTASHLQTLLTLFITADRVN